MTLVHGLVVFAAGCLAGWLGRYFVIEPAAMHAVCGGPAPAGWCAARDVFIHATFSRYYGIASVAAAVACWVLRGRAAAVFAMTALLAGGLGLFLYDASWSAAGVLIALLRTPRIADEQPDARDFTA